LVLIFFIGGGALIAIVGDEVSFTNGICQISPWVIKSEK
jgi:hypothetical protein